MADPAAIMSALFARAALMETQGPTLPVSFPEPAVPFIPPLDGKWLDVSFAPNRPAWEGLSSGRMDMGLLQVIVVWPRGEGEIKPAQAAGAVLAHFAKGTTLYSGSTKVVIASEPWLAAPIELPDRVNVPVLIPWVA
jgi:hypothetical protein